jgi:hypothetical protein
MANHTPGPWHSINGIIYSANDLQIAGTYCSALSHSDLRLPERTANAHLITAAPELAEALKLAERELSDWLEFANEMISHDEGNISKTAISETETALAAARAALRKAGL